MIRLLTFLAIVLVASVGQGATVKFSGTLGYNNVVGGDVLNITGKAFLATLETNNGSGVINGQLWLSPANVTATQQFNLTGGTITIAPGSTTFSGISVAGGSTVSFVLTQQAAGFSQADLFALQGSGGNSILVSGGTTYVAAIAAVPEPASMLALAGLVVGCGAVSYRRRRKLSA